MMLSRNLTLLERWLLCLFIEKLCAIYAENTEIESSQAKFYLFQQGIIFMDLGTYANSKMSLPRRIFISPLYRLLKRQIKVIGLTQRNKVTYCL